jgi:hypothetical protein
MLMPNSQTALISPFKPQAAARKAQASWTALQGGQPKPPRTAVFHWMV